MRWECDGKQKERESGPRGEIAPAYQIDVHHHQPAWRYHIWSGHLAERGSKSCFIEERVATIEFEVKKLAWSVIFTKIGKGQMRCIWYCLSSNNLAFLRNSISIIGFGQLWCTQNTLIADGYPHRMPTNQYFFLLFSFRKHFLFSKNPPRTFNGSSWSKTFGDKV